MRNKEIKSAIKEWKNKLIDNLKSHRNRNIEVYFIPKYWENDTLANYNLSYFNKNIKNKNDLISSKSEFFIIEKEYFKNIRDYSEKDLIKAEAKFENDKLIIDLGNDNFYFYYLNSKNNLCEGSIESKEIKKEKSIIEGFKFNPPHDFIYHCLNELKPEFKNNLVIYHINNFIFTYKNDEELINDLNKQKINNKGNNEDNIKVNNEKDIKIIKCIIFYFFSEYKYKYFLEQEIKYKNSKRITKNDSNFILINKEWINLFKEKYNYKNYKKKIDDYKINEDNYLNNLQYFKDINSEIIEPIKSTKAININLMNKTFTIFQNYELITPETYNILVNCFGKEKNEKIIELNVINIDLSYILVKYNSKMIEIIKIKDESERFLIIGQYNLDDNILKELLDKGFKTWLKTNKITEYKNYSIEIIENGKIIGMLYYLPKLEFNKNNETSIKDEEQRIEDNKIKMQNFKDERKQKTEANKKEKEETKGEIVDNNIEKDRFYSRINKMQEANEKENNQNIEADNNKVSRTKRKSKTIKYLECPLSLPPEGLVGLQNVGATCYMNAALQCFSNIERLRVYFLNHKSKIKKKENKLSSSLLTIFENLWEEPTVIYFVPQEFKDVISEMNPLFKGIQANDTKDLILFILETIHNELNEINNSINGNNNFANPLDYNSVFVNFSIFFRKNYNSIISNLFYGMNNSMMTCCTCQRAIHNVQCFNILIFPLEEVRKYKGYNQNIVSLNDCFDYNEKQEYMFGENQISCNYCNRMSNSLNQTKIIISPNVLIINLNRGRGLMYDIKLYFSEYIDIKKYIFYSASPHYYELVGVVSHLGSSDMSGHFIAFCKNSENCKWYKFNDAIVTESNIQEVLNFGVPYVLFYNYVKS